jgi:hypothetical protein
LHLKNKESASEFTLAQKEKERVNIPVDTLFQDENFMDSN